MKNQRAVRRRVARHKIDSFYKRRADRCGRKTDVERDFPDVNVWGDRRAVCRRCHAVMRDCEPSSHYGEFYHPSLDKKGKPHSCPNTGMCFSTYHTELVPFLHKAERRRMKRHGQRV